MPLLQQQPGISRREADKAFTLVELLVVVTITGILAALLLPSLSAAHEKSQRAVCKSNLRQNIIAIRMYADDNQDILPSAVDNHGSSHTIRVSDLTYSNFLAYLQEPKTLDCPNIFFGTVERHDANGYVIGYSYLGDTGVTTSDKGPDVFVPARKLSDPGTNQIMADANYWTKDATKFKIAPHTISGSAMVNASSFTTGLPGDKSADIGAVGGNVGYLNGSVVWKTMGQMSTFQAGTSGGSSGGGAIGTAGLAYGNW